MIDVMTVTDATGIAGDENGVADASVDGFDVAAVDCDDGAGVVAKEKNKSNPISQVCHLAIIRHR